MNKLTKTDLYKIGIISFLFLIIIIIAIITLSYERETLDPIQFPENKFTIVENYDVFFFVNNNINTYINYLIDENYVAVLNILEESFKENKKINLTNIMSMQNNYESNDKYFANLTKSYELNDNITVYYTKGKIINEGFERSVTVAQDIKFLLYADYKNMTVSIEPLERDLNEEEFINKKKEKEIRKNENNGLKQVNVSNYKNICILYLSDFLEKVYNAPEEIIEKVNNVETVEELQILANKNNLTTTIHSCNLKTNDENKRVYNIVDNHKNKYQFIENTIFDYNVSIT